MSEKDFLKNTIGEMTGHLMKIRTTIKDNAERRLLINLIRKAQKGDKCLLKAMELVDECNKKYNHEKNVEIIKLYLKNQQINDEINEGLDMLLKIHNK